LTSLELKGAELIKMFVTPNWIVEAFNVLKDFRPSLLPCFVNPLFDFFTLLKTHSIVDNSDNFFKAFPGNLLEPILAWIMQRHFMFLI